MKGKLKQAYIHWETFRYKSLILMNLILLIFLLVMTQIRPIDHIRDYRITRTGGSSIAEHLIYENREISQEFICEEGINTFEVFIKAQNLNYHGAFEVNLYDENNKLIKNWKTDKLDLTSGQKGEFGWIYYSFSGNHQDQGKKYRFEIRAPGLNESNAIIVTTYALDISQSQADSPIGKCILDNKETDRVLAFGAYKDWGNPFFWIAVIIVFLMSNLWWFNRKKSVEKTALIILLGTGIIMLMIMAPGSQPDEDYHYNSAVRLSNFILGKKDDVNEEEEILRNRFSVHYNTNDSFNKELTDYIDDSDETGSVPLGSRTDGLAYPLSYFAPALGITVARLFGCNYVIAYTLARVFNLLFYVAMAMIAIRLVPSKKELMLLICIMPLTMHQAASTSRDVLINGFAMIFFANTVRITKKNEKVSWLDVFVSICLIYVFAPIKIVYNLLSLMVFLIPGDRFRNRLDRVLKTLTVPVAVFGLMFVLQRSTINVNLTASTYAGLSDYYHINVIFQHPIKYLRMILNSAEYFSWYHLKCLIGKDLAGLTLLIDERYPVIFLVVLLLSAFADNEPHPFDKKQKLLSLFLFVLGYLALFATFSFANTTYGDTRVYGMQGRYLFPFAPLLFYGIGSKGITVNIERHRLFYAVWIVELAYIIDIMSQIAL